MLHVPLAGTAVTTMSVNGTVPVLVTSTQA